MEDLPDTIEMAANDGEDRRCVMGVALPN